MVGSPSRAKLTKLLEASQGTRAVQSDLRGWAPESGNGWKPTDTQHVPKKPVPEAIPRWSPGRHSRPATVAAGSTRRQPAAAGGLRRRLSAESRPGSRQGTPSVAWDRPRSRSSSFRPSSRGFSGSRPCTEDQAFDTVLCHHNMNKHLCPKCTGREKTPAQPHHVTNFFDENPQIHPKTMAEICKNMQERLYCRFRNTKAAFRYFDGAGCGAVHYPGFRSALDRLGLVDGSRDDQMRAMFHLCDQDGDGRITYQEFCRWIKVPDKHDNLMIRREDPYEVPSQAAHHHHQTTH